MSVRSHKKKQDQGEMERYRSIIDKVAKRLQASSSACIPESTAPPRKRARVAKLTRVRSESDANSASSVASLPTSPPPSSSSTLFSLSAAAASSRSAPSTPSTYSSSLSSGTFNLSHLDSVETNSNSDCLSPSAGTRSPEPLLGFDPLQQASSSHLATTTDDMMFPLGYDFGTGYTADRSHHQQQHHQQQQRSHMHQGLDHYYGGGGSSSSSSMLASATSVLYGDATPANLFIDDAFMSSKSLMQLDAPAHQQSKSWAASFDVDAFLE